MKISRTTRLMFTGFLLMFLSILVALVARVSGYPQVTAFVQYYLFYPLVLIGLVYMIWDMGRVVITGEF